MTITGTATQGQTLTATNTLADVDGLGTISYQWKANGAVISGATENAYTLTQAEVGKTITLTASYTDSYGTLESKTSTATSSVLNVNDVPTGAVTISGTAAQGETLTVANTLADVDGLGAINYQWKANDTVITGATDTSYTLTQDDVGKTFVVTASYTDGQGTPEYVSSNATVAVMNVNDLPTGNVTISGVATQRQTLSVANTLADLDGLGAISYQWKANGTAITGAIGNTYTLTQAEVGKTITVTASYVDGFGATESKTSAATAVVANVNDAPTGTVTISGTIAVGQTLTAANTLADVDGLGTISYQWKANGAAIGGATSASYTLTQAEVGKAITVTASYIDGQGTGETKTSAATTAVPGLGANTAPTGSVTISGVPTPGQTLTAANTLADLDGIGAISYQWKANGAAINGATGTTYTLTPADVGKAITVTASYTDGRGTAESKTSSATATVTDSSNGPALSKNDDYVVVQYASPAIVGAGVGNDTYLISGHMLPAGTKITISDVLGSNSLQLAPKLSLASFKVAASSLLLTLDTGAVITVLGADRFTYDVGGMTPAGIDNPDISYADFVRDTLGVTMPSGAGMVSGGALVLGVPMDGG